MGETPPFLVQPVDYCLNLPGQTEMKRLLLGKRAPHEATIPADEIVVKFRKMLISIVAYSILQIKAEKKQAKKEAAANAEADKLAKKKEKQASIKLRCDPFNDPGYLVQNSVNIQSLIEVHNIFVISCLT